MARQRKAVWCPGAGSAHRLRGFGNNPLGEDVETSREQRPSVPQNDKGYGFSLSFPPGVVLEVNRGMDAQMSERARRRARRGSVGQADVRAASPGSNDDSGHQSSGPGARCVSCGFPAG